MNEVELIKKLSTAFGPSGFEDDVIKVARDEMETICDIAEDHMRNLYMQFPQVENRGVNILIDAHSDEVGFIVQAIRPNGTLRFLPLGGWDAKNIIAGNVWVKNRDGKLISGIVCSKPVHFMKNSEKTDAIDFEDLLIDVGSTSAQETMEVFNIGIGAPVVPAVNCTYDENHKIFIGKGFDCRIGCAAVLKTMTDVKEMRINNTLQATLSSQEEVGERGMKCAMHTISPDVVICFEGCPSDDTFEEPCMIQAALKKGPMLRHFDKSMITNPRFQRFALDIADKYQIPVQESVRKGGGTNGGITHTMKFGIPTIVIGIPVRFAHSSYGITSLEDYQHAISLAKHIIEDINEEIVASL